MWLNFNAALRLLPTWSLSGKALVGCTFEEWTWVSLEWECWKTSHERALSSLIFACEETVWWRRNSVIEEEQCDGGRPGRFGSFGLYYTLIHTHTHTHSHTHSQSGTVSPHRQAQGAASIWSLSETLKTYSSLEQVTCCPIKYLCLFLCVCVFWRVFVWAVSVVSLCVNVFCTYMFLKKKFYYMLIDLCKWL